MNTKARGMASGRQGDSPLAEESPFHFLAGQVRNVREARGIISLDARILQYRSICDSLLACFTQEHELERLHSALLSSSDDARLRSAFPLVRIGLATVRASICRLLKTADTTFEQLAALRLELDWRCSANQTLVEELKSENCKALAAAKEQLWLIEASLLYRADEILAVRPCVSTPV